MTPSSGTYSFAKTWATSRRQLNVAAEVVYEPA